MLGWLSLFTPSHSRFACPTARSSFTGIKVGPCGTEQNDFSGAVTSIAPGPLTLHIEESVSHTGAPWRVSLSLDSSDDDACTLLDHIPHDDTSSPSHGVEATCPLLPSSNLQTTRPTDPALTVSATTTGLP